MARAQAPKKKAVRKAASPAKPPKPRRRRTPEDARAELLDVAERLLAERGPDAIGLRDIAREAEVSHGLITHYFKTYEGLVEAVLARRTARLATSLSQLAHGELSASSGQIVAKLLSVVSEPAHLRLVTWAALSGRVNQADFAPGTGQALRAIADATRSAAEQEALQLGAAVGPQEDIDYAIVLAISAAYGYVFGKRSFVASLARARDEHTDEKVMAVLQRMLRSVLIPEATREAVVKSVPPS